MMAVGEELTAVTGTRATGDELTAVTSSWARAGDPGTGPGLLINLGSAHPWRGEAVRGA